MTLFTDKLILDANILFSFFKKDSVRQGIIEELLNKGVELISPKFIIDELLKNKDKIIKFSDISSENFSFLLSSLKSEVILIPESEFEDFLSKANKLSPHSKDNPYFALSLSLDNSPIWSDELAFKNQSKIKILSTEELLDVFSK